jgi:hypothetical protein
MMSLAKINEEIQEIKIKKNELKEQLKSDIQLSKSERILIQKRIFGLETQHTELIRLIAAGKMFTFDSINANLILSVCLFIRQMNSLSTNRDNSCSTSCMETRLV